MACKLRQIICITGPVSSTEICLVESDGSILEPQLSYSTDCATWSDWMSCEEIPEFTSVLSDEFFLRAQVYGNPCKVTIENNEVDFTTSLAPSFDFTTQASESTYNPYANLDCAMALYQQLSENVSNIVGIPCYYFKVTGDEKSKDVTFKEYCHLNVTSVKFIKIIVAEGKMPSSKPQFTELGLDWETDWETQISKGTFATAFGNTAQPMEGDLVYIPMMKRMWQVNSAYEEKSEGFMWNNTCFNVYLRKYEIQEQISTGKFEETINTIVKNTYEDLFGDTVTGSNEETFSAPVSAEPKNNMYQIYEQDAYRKAITIDTIKFEDDSVYHKGMVLAETWYKGSGCVEYQKKYCGDTATISFMIQDYGGSGDILAWGDHRIYKEEHKIHYGDICVEISTGTWLVYFRWSVSLKRVEGAAIPVNLPENIPVSRIRPALYFLNFGKKVTSSGLLRPEDIVTDKLTVNFTLNGTDKFSSIKFFTTFEEVPQIVQQYPNSTGLLFNDTARKIVEQPGWPGYNNQY